VLDAGLPSNKVALLQTLATAADAQVRSLLSALAAVPDLQLTDLAQIDARVAAARQALGLRPTAYATLRFALYANAGAGYDLLKAKLSTDLRMRWDLADAARAQGEDAAMKVLLHTNLGGFVGQDAATLTIAAAARIGASDDTRQEILLAGFTLQKQNALKELLAWRGSDLSFASDALTELAEVTASDIYWRQGTDQTLTKVIADQRLPAASAIEIVKRMLANGGVETDGEPLTLWEAYNDACTALFSRPDVGDAQKRDVAQLFFGLFDRHAMLQVIHNAPVPKLAAFPADLSRAFLAERKREMEEERMLAKQKNPNAPDYTFSHYDRMIAALNEHSAVLAVG
jgi:hypothetical protein